MKTFVFIDFLFVSLCHIISELLWYPEIRLTLHFRGTNIQILSNQSPVNLILNTHVYDWIESVVQVEPV